MLIQDKLRFRCHSLKIACSKIIDLWEKNKDLISSMGQFKRSLVWLMALHLDFPLNIPRFLYFFAVCLKTIFFLPALFSALSFHAWIYVSRRILINKKEQNKKVLWLHANGFQTVLGDLWVKCLKRGRRLPDSHSFVSTVLLQLKSAL